jgi:hypothetical protein
MAVSRELICPNCSKPYVARVARVGFSEEVLSLFYLYPFKCQLCGRRFRILQWGVRYHLVEEDRREYERSPTTFPLSFTDDAIAGTGIAYDVSMSGCGFHPTLTPGQGAVLRMALRISRDFPPVQVEAVVRNVRENRVGVEFLRFDPVHKARLQNYVRELLKNAPINNTEPGTQPANTGVDSRLTATTAVYVRR